MRVLAFSGNLKVPPEMSIVVVMRRFPSKNIEALLDSTKQITSKHEIIVVTGCPIEKGANVELNFKRLLGSNQNLVEVRVAELPSDKGLAFGRNVGAVLAHSSNLVFLDDDIVLLDDPALLLHYLEDNVCQGVQPLLLRSADRQIVDSAGDFVRKGRTLFYQAYSKGCDTRIESLGVLCVEELPSMRGAFMMIRKEPLLDVGCFDDTFSFNFDDVDLGWRMVVAGYKLLIVPTVRALHKGGRTTDATVRDDRAIMFGLINSHATHLKIMSFFLWPYVFVRFFDRLLRHEVSKLKKGQVSAAGVAREMATTTCCLLGKIGWVIFHKRVLAREFGFCGRLKLESMARGERFVLSCA